MTTTELQAVLLSGHCVNRTSWQPNQYLFVCSEGVCFPNGDLEMLVDGKDATDWAAGAQPNIYAGEYLVLATNLVEEVLGLDLAQGDEP